MKDFDLILNEVKLEVKVQRSLSHIEALQEQPENPPFSRHYRSRITAQININDSKAN